jgi:LPS O-antigen subunit length determinant protein (WzzB/FepE family)
MDEVQKKEEIKDLKDFVLTISDQNGKQHDQDFISKLDSVFKSLDEFLRSEKDSFKDFFKELNKDASLSGIVRKDNLASISPGDIDKPGTSVSSVRANNVFVSTFHR